LSWVKHTLILLLFSYILTYIVNPKAFTVNHTELVQFSLLLTLVPLFILLHYRRKGLLLLTSDDIMSIVVYDILLMEALLRGVLWGILNIASPIVAFSFMLSFPPLVLYTFEKYWFPFLKLSSDTSMGIMNKVASKKCPSLLRKLKPLKADICWNVWRALSDFPFVLYHYFTQRFLFPMELGIRSTFIYNTLIPSVIMITSNSLIEVIMLKLPMLLTFEVLNRARGFTNNPCARCDPYDCSSASGFQIFTKLDGLEHLWSVKLGKEPVVALKYSNGMLGVAPSRNSNIFVLNANSGVPILVRPTRSNVVYTDANEDLFIFLDNDGFCELVDLTKRTIREVRIPLPSISTLKSIDKNRFLACRSACTLVDLSSDIPFKWIVDLDGLCDTRPALLNNNLLLIPVRFENKLLIVDMNTGNIIKRLEFENSFREAPINVVSCGRTIVLLSMGGLRIFEVEGASDLREVWRFGGFKLAFQAALGEDCRTLWVADRGGYAVYKIDLGDFTVKRYNTISSPNAIELQGDLLFIGTMDGWVHAYKISTIEKNLK